MGNRMTQFLQDICYLKLFPKRYKTTQIADRKAREVYWRKVGRAYGNFKKRVEQSDYHWYVITFKDGRSLPTSVYGESLFRMVADYAGESSSQGTGLPCSTNTLKRLD